MEYKDVLIALMALGLILGSILTALGLWEIKKRKKETPT